MLRFGYDDSVMRHLAILFIHLIVTIARLLGPAVLGPSLQKRCS